MNSDSIAPFQTKTTPLVFIGQVLQVKIRNVWSVVEIESIKEDTFKVRGGGNRYVWFPVSVLNNRNRIQLLN